MTFLRFQRTSQPQTPLVATYSGLVYAWIPATDTLSKSGTITRKPTRHGLSVVTESNAYEFMTSAPKFSLDSCSVLAILTPTTTNVATLYAVSCGNSTSANPLFVLGQGATSGHLSFRTRDSANTNVDASATSSEWVDKATAVCIGVRSKSLATQRVFSNGKLVASVAVGSAAATTFDRFAIGCLLRSSAALFWTGGTSLVAIFDRVLSDAEIKNLSANPWQLFRPVARVIWAPDTSGVVASNAPRYFHRTQSGQA